MDDGSHRHRPVMSEGFRVEDGIDMFVFADGKIRVPTVVHHVQHG